MTMRRRGRRSFARGRRKRTQWINFGAQINHVAAAGFVAVDLTPEPMQTAEEGTAKCLRMLLNFELSMPLINAAVHRIGIGICVMTHEGFSQVAFPSPFSGDNSFGWYYFRFQTIQHVTAAQPAVSWDVDISTQRLLRAGYKLVLVTETIAQAASVDLNVGARLLWEIN